MIENLKSKYSETGPERVGFIVNGEVIEVQNTSGKPDEGFLIADAAVLYYTEEVIAEATWHTHPNQSSNLSGKDYPMFRDWPEMDHYIVGNDGVRCYRYDKAKGAVLQK